MPVAFLDSVSHAFGHLPLLDRASLQIDSGERVCLIGRNGAGKSTLLRIVSGEQAPDSGTVWREPGLRTARLDQDVPLSVQESVFDAVAGGLGDLSRLVADYHHAVVALAESHTPEDLEALGRLQHELEERDGWQIEQRVELILDRLGLSPDRRVDSLSGGWRRRVLLARTLVADPGLLLLDEPTNHLDIEAILWLETFLTEYAGAVIFVTHDRAFLQKVATRIIEIDRGRLVSWPGDYANFLRRKEEWLADEAVRAAKFDKRLAEEEVWLRQGIKARRTRNEGRVRALIALRAERAARREQSGNVRLTIERAADSGKLVFEAKAIEKSYGTTSVIRDFSTRVMRGDRIGLIGPNGAGKTTLLRLLTGELTPDAGEVRRGANVDIAYFDQQREQLDPDRTVFDTVGDGNDTVTVGGRSRHVNAYLQDFLFPLARATSPVKALSGGERNRLLLARLFTRPANMLILDEPTNDLDLETLELLEAQLVEWSGTLLIVSHDRAFLDNVITSTMVFEGNGVVREYVGGYEDWLRQRPRAGRSRTTAVPIAGAGVGFSDARVGPGDESEKPVRKLSYKEQRELSALPAKIEDLEKELKSLEARAASTDFYKEPAGEIAGTLARIETIPRELSALYERWDALESRR